MNRNDEVTYRTILEDMLSEIRCLAEELRAEGHHRAADHVRDALYDMGDARHVLPMNAIARKAVRL